MKIVFNAMNCGLGNNGGTQTIVLSANTLVDMGHDVSIVNSMKNQHTWNQLKAKHIIINHKNKRKIPECDCIIGTGIKTFKSTLNCDQANKKFHWIRGWETWQLSEQKMVDMFEKNYKNIHLLTNGAGIQNKLKRLDIPSTIQLAGLDLDKTDIVYESVWDNRELNIGGLVNTRHKTKQTDFIYNIFSYVSKMASHHYNVNLYTYGAEEVKRKPLRQHHHISHPSNKIKNKIYKKVNFWISSSISEGFHIPPAEFMQVNNGGVVLGIDSDLNGTKQYLHQGKTGFLFNNDWKEIADFILQNLEYGNAMSEISNNAYNYIRDEIGSRKHNMKKLVEILEMK